MKALFSKENTETQDFIDCHYDKLKYNPCFSMRYAAWLAENHGEERLFEKMFYQTTACLNKSNQFALLTKIPFVKTFKSFAVAGFVFGHFVDGVVNGVQI